MKAAVLAVAVGALGMASACTTQTDCNYVNKAPSGDLATDVVGCWQGFGPDSLVVYEFLDDQTFNYIEPPNRFASAGLRVSGGWTVPEGAVLFIGSDENRAEITETTLRLINVRLGFRDNLRRAMCTGFGFEDGRTCPQ
jgi:hypothetical protein